MLGVAKLDRQFREVFILSSKKKKSVHLSVFFSVTRKISIYDFYELFSYSSVRGIAVVVKIWLSIFL